MRNFARLDSPLGIFSNNVVFELFAGQKVQKKEVFEKLGQARFPRLVPNNLKRNGNLPIDVLASSLAIILRLNPPGN